MNVIWLKNGFLFQMMNLLNILKFQGDNKYNFLCVIKKPSIYR